MKITHGGEIKAFARKGGIDETQVMDFSSNINPLGLPDSVKLTYAQSYHVISKYPDAQAMELRQTIADITHLNTSNILTGNGSISLIDLVIRSLKPKNALLIEPCFNEYRRLLQLSQVNIESIALKDDNNFQLPFKTILNRLKESDLLILGHPNNPTGTSFSANQLAYLMEFANNKKKYILIDEAFIDWNLKNSVLSYIQHNASLIVTRSLTKFYALAGIRAGYACAHEEIIEKMQMHQETWGCNGLAQKLSISALNDHEFQTISHNWFKEEHAFMFDSLNQIPSIKVFPSQANFFLCKILSPNVTDIFWETMCNAGIYVRAMNDLRGLDQSYFRLALKSRSENLYFLKRLNAITKDRMKKDLSCLS